MKKRIMVFSVCFIMLFSILMPTSNIKANSIEDNLEVNNEFNIITPYYDYINMASSTLTIENGIAYVGGSLQKTPLGYGMYLRCVLEKNVDGYWSAVMTWSTASTTTNYIYISEAYPVTKGEYRVATYYSVTGANGTEFNTVYSKIVNYK